MTYSRKSPPLLALESTNRAPAGRTWLQRIAGWRYGGLLLILGAYLLINACLRVALALREMAQLGSVGAWIPTAAVSGFVFDLGAGMLVTGVLGVLLSLVPAAWFARRAFRWAMVAIGTLTLAVMVFGAVAEWVFWEEFGARFNFIAVDYLVYTTEVMGNIRESYPLPAIFAGIGLLAAAMMAGAMRLGWLDAWLDGPISRGRLRVGEAMLVLTVAGLPAFVLHERMVPPLANVYHHELAKNGLWSLFAAFRANELSYARFYRTLESEAAAARMATLVTVDGSAKPASAPDLDRWVEHPGTEMTPNVIQITVESLSADFMATFGNTQGLTPRLDALAPQSLVFTKLYATGNRTDRGMEALTLAVPPTPGRSLIKRPGHANLFSLGSVLRSRNYETAFLYGGYGYFDNMNDYFSANGYRVVDRSSVAPEDITFANAWGACDGDLYRWTLREADRAAATGKPFHFFVMTTSNHRPYTYPEGVIDLPPKISGRAGAVKYSDAAIGAFLDEASRQPWYQNTVFVIVADHCASSAGRTELPVDKYHIPMLIFAPGGQIAPGTIDTLCSQIDYPPTLLGLLQWSYRSRFYGRDLTTLDAGTPGRALIANYQKLGLLEEDRLVILAPKQEVTVRPSGLLSISPALARPDEESIADAISYYQNASFAFAHGIQMAVPQPLP